MFVLIKSQTCKKMGHVWSKTRSLGQILDKPCVCSRGLIFCPLIIKLVENVCLDEFLDEFENGSCWVKKRSLGQILEKLSVRSKGHFLYSIIMKLVENVCLDEVSHEFKKKSCWVKN